MDLKKIAIRALSGLVYIAIIIGCIMMHTEGISVLAILLGTLASIEFTKITGGLTVRRIPAVLADVAGIWCLSLAFFGLPALGWILCLIWRLVAELYLKEDDPLQRIAYSFMAQIYVGVPMALMVGISQFFGVPHMLLALFMFIWINDTGAFLVGCSIGRHRLFERISPKKSWEGFFGGFILNLVAAAVIAIYFPQFFGFGSNVAEWLGLGTLVTVLATWGDLVESMIKRTLRIKDSGNLIPGHGGILDRIDSLLLVMPAAFLYIFIIKCL